MKTKVTDVYFGEKKDLEPISPEYELGLQPVTSNHVMDDFMVPGLGMSVEEVVTELNNRDGLLASVEGDDDEIEIPPAPEGMSVVEWLIEQHVIPAGTPVFEVSDATDVADIIAHAEGLDKGKTIH